MYFASAMQGTICTAQWDHAFDKVHIYDSSTLNPSNSISAQK